MRCRQSLRSSFHDTKHASLAGFFPSSIIWLIAVLQLVRMLLYKSSRLLARMARH